MAEKIKKDPAPAETLAEGVERKLLEYIRQGNLQVGDFLPKEEDLATALQCSRHVIREGISRLKVLGLVEARKHRGTVIAQPGAFNSLKKIAEVNLFTPEECKGFMEMRVALELGMTNFVYLRKTPEALQKLRVLAGKPDQLTHNFKDELAFHSALLGIAGNSIAGEFREIIYNAFYPVYAKARRDYFAPTVTHCEICDALENATLQEFQRVMQQHFQYYLVG
ncbi:MAG: FadR family transcriptional regulator [Lentisphaeria bacterium]|nr:FadR family transcriptional regulator [Lentisphaeria bacterium]